MQAAFAIVPSVKPNCTHAILHVEARRSLVRSLPAAISRNRVSIYRARSINHFQAPGESKSLCEFRDQHARRII